jgi:Ca2+/Na+ antiporter
MPEDQSVKVYEDIEYSIKLINSLAINDDYIPTEQIEDTLDEEELTKYRSKECYSVQWRLYELKSMIRKGFENKDWNELNYYEKVLYIPFGALFSFLLRISIPPISDERWDRRFATLTPICGFTILLITLGLYENVFVIVIGYLISIVLCMAIYCNTYNHLSPSIIVVYSAFGFLVSLVWLYLTSSFLIDIIQLILLIINIDKSYVGLTILSIGGSLPGNSF